MQISTHARTHLDGLLIGNIASVLDRLGSLVGERDLGLTTLDEVESTDLEQVDT